MLRRSLLRDMLLAGSMGPWGRAAARVQLGGTFLQLNTSYESWSDDQWQTLFHDLRRLGASEIIVQWSVLDETAFYPSESFRAPGAALTKVFSLAAEAGVDITLGLASEGQFWRQLDRPPPHLQAYLREQLQRSSRVARELVRLYGNSPSFRGWYITEEIDDLHWRAPASRGVLLHYIASLCQGLKEVSAARPIGISGFAQGRMSPGALAELWTDVLRAGIDTIWFQDGIGVGNLDFATLPVYLESLQNATRNASCHLRIVVEAFEQIQDAQAPAKFVAQPAPFERLRQQIEVAARFDTTPVVFTLAEYLSQLGGVKAGESLARYLEWQKL